MKFPWRRTNYSLQYLNIEELLARQIFTLIFISSIRGDSKSFQAYFQRNLPFCSLCHCEKQFKCDIFVATMFNASNNEICWSELMNIFAYSTISINIYLDLLIIRIPQQNNEIWMCYYIETFETMDLKWKLSNS